MVKRSHPPADDTQGRRVARLSLRMVFRRFVLDLFPYPGPLAQLVELRTFNP